MGLFFKYFICCLDSMGDPLGIKFPSLQIKVKGVCFPYQIGVKMASVKKKRKTKMNRHKLKKLRKQNRHKNKP
ncbi:MAG: AURKAIP1/COX24 domain-containing protein [Chlamydiia bacterium]